MSQRKRSGVTRTPLGSSRRKNQAMVPGGPTSSKRSSWLKATRLEILPTGKDWNKHSSNSTCSLFWTIWRPPPLERRIFFCPH